MKIINQTNNQYLLRFDMGEELLSSLGNFATDNNITAASFAALGAASDITLAYYNLQTKQYEDHLFSEDAEILSINGNVAMLNGKQTIHCHGVFGRKDCTTIGGHIKKLIVSATCEVMLTKLDGIIERAFDEKTGLNLLQ